MSGIRAIETEYRGRRFRSRLEARWAVFFDSLGVAWDYEPQGFEFEFEGEKVRYLPDFYLPEIGVWFEVKGRDDTGEEKHWLFGRRLQRDGGGDRLVVAVGPLPSPDTLECTGHPYYGDFDMLVCGDQHHAWCVCPSCRHPDIQFDARGARVSAHNPGCTAHDLHKCYSGDDPKIRVAYADAIGARFEHGEEGAS